MCRPISVFLEKLFNEIVGTDNVLVNRCYWVSLNGIVLRGDQCWGTGLPWESGHMEHNGHNADAMDTGHTRVTSIETHVITLVHHV